MSQGVAGEPPPHVLAMVREVASLVLDDWMLERGWTFRDDVRESTIATLAAHLERAASDPGGAARAFAPLACAPPDVLRRHMRAWAEPALRLAFDDVARRFVWADY